MGDRGGMEWDRKSASRLFSCLIKRSNPSANILLVSPKLHLLEIYSANLSAPQIALACNP